MECGPAREPRRVRERGQGPLRRWSVGGFTPAEGLPMKRYIQLDVQRNFTTTIVVVDSEFARTSDAVAVPAGRDVSPDTPAPNPQERLGEAFGRWVGMTDPNDLRRRIRLRGMVEAMVRDHVGWTEAWERAPDDTLIEACEFLERALVERPASVEQVFQAMFGE